MIEDLGRSRKPSVARSHISDAGLVRVLNSGAGSFNSEQEEAFLRKFAGRLHPDAVMLTYVSNDVIAHPPFRRDADIPVEEFSPPQRIQLRTPTPPASSIVGWA